MLNHGVDLFVTHLGPNAFKRQRLLWYRFWLSFLRAAQTLKVFHRYERRHRLASTLDNDSFSPIFNP